jgi:organic hydroperoxide reductase OsmC/OhrA
MKSFPHLYGAGATGSASGTVRVRSAGLPDLTTAPPPQFDGPEGIWSPETLLLAAIADCFILTFRGVARAARFEWQTLDAEVEGTLERIDGVTRFTRYQTRATLKVDDGADRAKAGALLERAEKLCLVANSLNGERMLEISVQAVGA